MTVTEIASLICSRLEKAGFSCVLSGGACVTIYSKNEYQSADLDFVMSDYSLKEIDGTMLELGFTRKGHMRHYVNPGCPYYVEFPSPPLAVGEELIKKTALLKTPYGQLRILTPTDCVKDRLAAFYHWKDRQSLEQAILVARHQKVDLTNIEKWSKNEGAAEKFEEFRRLSKAWKKTKSPDRFII